MTPMETVENVSSEARTGNSVPCSPWPVNSIETPISNAAIGANVCLMVADFVLSGGALEANFIVTGKDQAYRQTDKSGRD